MTPSIQAVGVGTSSLFFFFSLHLFAHCFRVGSTSTPRHLVHYICIELGFGPRGAEAWRLWRFLRLCLSRRHAARTASG